MTFPGLERGLLKNPLPLQGEAGEECVKNRVAIAVRGAVLSEGLSLYSAMLEAVYNLNPPPLRSGGGRGGGVENRVATHPKRNVNSL